MSVSGASDAAAERPIDSTSTRQPSAEGDPSREVGRTGRGREAAPKLERTHGPNGLFSAISGASHVNPFVSSGSPFGGQGSGKGLGSDFRVDPCDFDGAP